MNGTVSDIIAKYDDTIEKTISLYKVRARQYGLDLDDIRQICRITIWGCLKYKSDSSPEFIPYIKTSMRKAIRSYIIRNSTGKSRQSYDKKTLGKYLSMSELPVTFCDNKELVWRAVTEDLQIENENENVEKFITSCRNIDPVLAEIINLRMNGYTREAVSKKICIPGRTYDRRIATIKTLYREFFEEDKNDSQKPSTTRTKGQSH